MITLENGNVQTPASLIVPNGSMTLQLNVDGTVIAAPYGIVLANEPVLFQFDSTGNLQSGAQIYSNAELQPQNSNGLGTYYLVTFYDANGARINKNPMWWQFTEPANSTVNISAMTPYMVAGGNIIYYPIPVGGDGTVTSVAFVGDGVIFSTTPSTPVTSAGDIGPTLLTQNANTFLAGPATGAAADPTFRAITAADLPGGTITGSIAATQVAFGSGADAIEGNSSFTYTLSDFALQISNGTLGTIYVGTLDAAFTAATPSGSYAPIDYGAGQLQVANRVGLLNASTNAAADQVAFGVINQDNLANSLAQGFMIGFSVNSLSTCASNLNFNYPVFPGGINGGVIQSRHIGTGNLTGTNYGVVALTTSAAVQSTSHVSTVVSLIADTGGFSGATVDLNVAIWIPGLSDPGTTLGTGIGLYMAPVTSTFTTLWGIYVDGTATPNFFGGSSTLKAIQISNLTAATSGANQSSPLESFAGQYWTGTITAQDIWTIQDVLGTGSNPSSTLALVHSGSTGVLALQIPSAAALQFGTDTGLSRGAAGVVAVGSGAPGNASGTVNAAQYNVAGSQIAAANLANGTTGTGAIVLAGSPALTGTPTVPTAATGTNTTQAASTAFVQAQLVATGVPVTKKVTLTTTQLENLASTPIVLVPAPGAGFYTIPLAVSFVYNPGTTPFTTTFAPSIGVYYDWTGFSPYQGEAGSSQITAIAAIALAAEKASAGALNLGLNTLSTNFLAPTVSVNTTGKPANMLENIALKITSTGSTSGATVTQQVIAGPIPSTGLSIAIPGVGFQVGDVVFVGAPSSSVFQYTVTSVNATGGVTGLSQNNATSLTETAFQYFVANNSLGSIVSSTNGVGLYLNVTSVVGGGNGIASSSVNAAGSGYNVGDTGTITINGRTGGASGTATYVVNTLTGGAGTGVATYTITSVGGGYFPASGVATAHTTGSGTGFTLNILTTGGGYAVNDTGTYGNGTYIVNSVDANGNVLTYTVTSAPTNQVLGTIVVTAKGGGQPGVGFGFSLLVTQTAWDATGGNGSVDVNITYLTLAA